MPSFISEAAVEATGPWRWAIALYAVPVATQLDQVVTRDRVELGARSPIAAMASSRRSRPITAAPMWPRSLVSTAMPTPQPPCSGPSRQSAGTCTSVKNTSSNSASPVICRSGRTSTPGRSMSSRKNEMPCASAGSGSVRAIRMPQSL